MARPRSENPRCCTVVVQLTKAERLFVEEEAVNGHCSLSEVLRGAVLKAGRRPVVPEVNRNCWSKLAATTANLNQLQRSINAGKLADTEQLLPVLNKLSIEVRQLRLALLGVSQNES